MPLGHDKPNRALLRELNAVVRRAEALEEALGRANYLPPTFPESQTKFWIDQLRVLPEGTAEGCRFPLLYGHEQLSAVIRDHIGIDDDRDADAAAEDLEEPPSLARGEPIEQAITNLLGAIAVANSEYERQADEVPEDRDRDRSFRPTADQASVLGKLAERADDLRAEAERLGRDLRDAANVNETETVDRLRRQTRDAETALSVTEHAVRQPAIRPSLATRLSRAMSSIARAAVTTWKVVRLGVDLTRLGVKCIGNYTSELADLPFKHWDEFASEFEAKIQVFWQASTKPRGPSAQTPFETFRSIDALWCPEMVMLPAGTFLMGSPDDEEGRSDKEGPQHEVEITRPFALGRFAVTFDEYDHFCAETDREKPNDNGWNRGRRPVINVSHDDALAYCAWLSAMTDFQYRLPTEAEWEYACRAGTTTAFSFGESISADQVNYGSQLTRTNEPGRNVRGPTVSVGTLPPNSWGLYEMHGNVLEWCLDGRRRYTDQAIADPLGPTDAGAERVLRGGSWRGDARDVRAASRNAGVPGAWTRSVGFRCAGVQEGS